MTDPPLRVSSLDTPESNSQGPTYRSPAGDLNWSTCCTFRHSGWRADRQRVNHALARTGQPANQQYDFRTCGLYAYVLQSIDDPTRYRVAGSSCHNRFCVPCANERSTAISANILTYLKGKPARFVTLTLRSTNEPLSDLLDKLTISFARLRRRAIWRKRVSGGISMIELKWNAGLSRWNVHLHCILTGLYIKAGLLSQAWKAITRDSMIVDIRFVRDERQVARYVTKYASKPLSRTVLHDPTKLDEAIIALKGRRLATTFGTWRGVLLTPKPDNESWTNLGSLQAMITAAETGDTASQAILRTLTVPFASTPPTTRAPPATSAFGTGAFHQPNLPALILPTLHDIA